MAFDKVVDSAVLDAGLKQIADAIREKAGTSDALAFPAGFSEAIAAIEAGGGGDFACGTIALAEDVVIGTDPGFIIETGYVSKSGNVHTLNFVLLLMNGRSSSGQYNTHAVLYQRANVGMSYKNSTSTTAKYDNLYYDYSTSWEEYCAIDPNTGRVVIKAKNASQKLNSFYGKSRISWAIWEEEQ